MFKIVKNFDIFQYFPDVAMNACLIQPHISPYSINNYCNIKNKSVACKSYKRLKTKMEKNE